jgi:uncharacterized membrane protein (DUF2068 family)
MHHAHQQQRLGTLRIIAAFKFFKALLLISAGIATVGILNPTWSRAVHQWIRAYAFGVENDMAHRALAWFANLSPQRAEALGLGLFAYGSLFVVEGIGLWSGRRWGEYLTVIATGLLIPLEIYELIQKFTLPRLVALVINVAIVIYLIVRLRENNKESG